MTKGTSSPRQTEVMPRSTERRAPYQSQGLIRIRQLALTQAQLSSRKILRKPQRLMDFDITIITEPQWPFM